MLFPPVLVAVVTALCGAIIGSFLNMAIWRLPQRKPTESVFFVLNNPRRSYCPSCNHSLGAIENIPLFSFLALRARCRHCKAPISWRYFSVEVLTVVVFVSLFLHFGPTANTVAYCLFFSALIAAFFIDIAHFIIPDELNTFALVVGIGRDLLGIIRHEPGHGLVWGWMPHSILNGMICASIFVFIQILGYALFRKEAMGDGDVKLARAIGSLLPLGQALVSFLVAIGVGAVVGGGLLAWQAIKSGRAGDAATEVQNDNVEEVDEEEADEGVSPFWGLVYIPYGDLFVWLAAKLRVPIAVRWMTPLSEEAEEDDEFIPGPTHIPFGPYMVVGAFLAVFVGDALIQAYLRWAHLG